MKWYFSTCWVAVKFLVFIKIKVDFLEWFLRLKKLTCTLESIGFSCHDETFLSFPFTNKNGFASSVVWTIFHKMFWEKSLMAYAGILLVTKSIEIFLNNTSSRGFGSTWVGKKLSFRQYSWLPALVDVSAILLWGCFFGPPFKRFFCKLHCSPQRSPFFNFFLLIYLSLRLLKIFLEFN